MNIRANPVTGDAYFRQLVRLSSTGLQVLMLEGTQEHQQLLVSQMGSQASYRVTQPAPSPPAFSTATSSHAFSDCRHCSLHDTNVSRMKSLSLLEGKLRTNTTLAVHVRGVNSGGRTLGKRPLE